MARVKAVLREHRATGVNGLEAGQTFIVACAVIFHNLTMLSGAAGSDPGIRSDSTARRDPWIEKTVSLVYCQMLNPTTKPM